MVKKLRGVLSYFLHHKKISAILIIALLLLWYIMSPKNVKSIEVTAVKKSNITQTVNASGVVTAVNYANLAFLSSGKLTYVGVKKGDQVTAGQTIATLDQRSLKANLQQALIDYEKQRNTYDTTQDANQNHKPDDALNITMKRLLENNQNDLEKAVNSVTLQHLALEQSVLSSPISGIVTRADAEVAGMIATPQTVYSIADPTDLIFNIDVDEADISKVVVGQKVNLSFDAYPDQVTPLKVTKIDFASHKTDTGGTVYTVETQLPLNSNNRYRLGMNGDAEIITAEKKNVILIPLSALADENHVFVKTEKGFEKRKVTLGLQSDTDAEVVNGLTIGEYVSSQPDEVVKKYKL